MKVRLAVLWLVYPSIFFKHLFIAVGWLLNVRSPSASIMIVPLESLSWRASSGLRVRVARTEHRHGLGEFGRNALFGFLVHA